MGIEIINTEKVSDSKLRNIANNRVVLVDETLLLNFDLLEIDKKMDKLRGERLTITNRQDMIKRELQKLDLKLRTMCKK